MHYPEYKKQLNQMEQEHRLRQQGEELRAEHHQQEQLGGRFSRRARLIAYLIVLILIILAIMVVVFVFH